MHNPQTPLSYPEVCEIADATISWWAVICSHRNWKMFSHTYWSNALMVFIKPHLCRSIHERTFHVPTLCPQGKTRNILMCFFSQHYNQKIKPLRRGEGKEGGAGGAASHACSVSCKRKTDVWVLHQSECVNSDDFQG